MSQEIPDRLKHLVFHTAFVVEDGASVNDNFPPEQTDMFGKAASESPDNTVECSWEVFRDFFIQDARPQDARSVWERLDFLPDLPGRLPFPGPDRGSRMGCVCHDPRLAGPVCHNPRTTAASPRGLCATTPV